MSNCKPPEWSRLSVLKQRGRRWDKSLSNIWLSWPPSRQQTFNSWARHSLGRVPSTSCFALHYFAHWVLCSLCTLHKVLILHSLKRVLCILCMLHSANIAQCSQFIMLIVHNVKKVLCTLAHCMVYICTIFWKCTLCTSFNAWLHSEQLAGRTFCIEDNLHSGRLRSRYLPLWIFVTMGARILRYNCMVPFNILVESLDKRPPGHNTHFLYTDSCP